MKPESGVIDENATAKQIADKLAAPTVKADKTGLEWQDVPEGVTVEFLADYEQVVGRDGKIYQPLRETTVKGIYKVTKGEETAEGAREHTVTIPGKYDNAGTNAKPVVIPELAEWYGGTEAGSVKIGEGTKIVYKDAAFKAAAEALAADYKAEYGVDLQVADSGEDAGDIVFTKDDKNGLGEEGYIMEMDDKVNVKAEQAQGAYWSTRSILQIVKLNNGEIPKGITKDYPKFKVRSFSLDVARKPASLESLEDFVDAMAYYKMNDFQVHLNDNLIFYENFESAEVARERAYTGFRLESDIKAGGENKKDLTNEDLFYTKEDFRNFIEESEAQGVSIVPEIDAPGHSGAFTKVRPDLMLPQNQAVNGNAKRAGEQFDLSGDVNSKDSQYGKSLSFVQGVWDEYLTDNMFDDSMTVHIGTDEYYGENVTVTATPNKEYKFAGWYDILTGEKVSDDAEYTFAVEMNTSLIAHFTKNGETPDPQPKEWTVTIDGTGHKVKDGETLTVEEPSKPGHAFAGFYLVGTDTAVDFTKPITSDMNVESRFTQYKVTAVESENGTITVSEMNDKGEVTVTAKANDGYIFKGWKVDGKETEALGTPYTFVPVKDTTVEAVYEKKDDTKVYHTVIINGQTVTVEDGKTLDRPADPVKEGYKFIGWFVDGKEFDFNTPITGDLKIEARFEKLPTTDKNDKNDKNDKVEGAVQTGDTANAVPWIVCLGVAAGAGVVVLKSRKKRS